MWKLISGMSLAFGILTVAAADEAPAKPKPEVVVEFCGRLRHGVMAIGGESTGTNISFNRVIWELKLKNDADKKFAEQHHKKTVVVSGSLRKVAGIERGDRWIIDVKKLSEQDATRDKEGVRMAILGTLKTAPACTGKPASMAIDSGGQVWPVDLSLDTKLKIAAESLVGQRILLVGILKPAPEESPEAQPGIQATAMKQPPEVPTNGRAD